MKRLLIAVTFATGCAATPGAETVESEPRAPAKVVQLVTGTDHTCALLENGEVWCFGRSESGQSGPSLSFSPFRAQRVVGLGPASAIAAHEDSTCALVEGALYCFGNNRWGRLGVPSDGKCRDYECVQTPRKVPAIRDARALAMGDYGTCVVRGDGAVFCVRPDQTYGLVVAQRRAGVENATQIAVGTSHACALREDRRVVCWGRNTYGSLGVPDRAQTAAVVVPNVENVVELRAAADATCTRDDRGTIRCWGVLAGTPIDEGAGTTLYPGVETSFEPVIAKGGPFVSFAMGGEHPTAYCMYDCYLGVVSSCTTDQLGEVVCHSEHGRSLLDAKRPLPGTPETMSVGPASLCFAIDNTIRCRGSSGLLGARPEPIAFPSE